RHAYGVAPLGPRSVVIAHTGLAQQMREHEPGVAGPLADAAIDDGFVVGVEEAVELFEFLAAAESPALVDRLAPRNRPGGGDVAAAQHAFLRVVGHMCALAGVLVR